MRVISLLPAATEAIFALGKKDCLVGVSHECDFPPEATNIPVVTRPRFHDTGSSREIDARVRSALEHGEAMYELDVALVRALAPDLIVAQDQCQVCALPAQQLDRLQGQFGLHFARLELHAHDLEGIWEDLRRLAIALGAGQDGEDWVASLIHEVELVRERAARTRYRPATLCLEWLDPPMVAGNWMPELVDIAGGRPLLARRGEPSRMVSWESIVEAAPEVLILAPCGFAIDRTLQELPYLRLQPAWARLPAVRNRRVYIIDGKAYANRPGPRIVTSVQILAALLQPGLCGAWATKGGWQQVRD